MLDEIRTLFAYNAWANARVLDAAERLGREQYTSTDDSHWSIRDTLVHTIAAEWLWLQRWRGDSPAGLWYAEDFPDVPTLRARWAEVERDTANFIAALAEPDLQRAVSYVNFQGETWSYPLWQQLLHQVNHGTQHRAEAALLLTRHGHSPGWLDFLYYLDERGATA